MIQCLAKGSVSPTSWPDLSRERELDMSFAYVTNIGDLDCLGRRWGKRLSGFVIYINQNLNPHGGGAEM